MQTKTQTLMALGLGAVCLTAVFIFAPPEVIPPLIISLETIAAIGGFFWFMANLDK